MKIFHQLNIYSIEHFGTYIPTWTLEKAGLPLCSLPASTTADRLSSSLPQIPEPRSLHFLITTHPTMPADYESTARALAISTSPEPHTSPDADDQPLWGRASRRNSTRGDQTATWRDRLINKGKAYYRKAAERWERMTFWQKVGFYAVSLLTAALGIGFMVLTGKIFIWLGPVAERWEKSPLVAFVLWILVFFVSFPPLLGWSTLGTAAGFIFGVWKG